MDGESSHFRLVGDDADRLWYRDHHRFYGRNSQALEYVSLVACLYSRVLSPDIRTCRIGQEIGIDPKVILATSHGRRTVDTLKALGRDDLANWDCMSEVSF
jgi:hypothetical protein